MRSRLIQSQDNSNPENSASVFLFLFFFCKNTFISVIIVFASSVPAFQLNTEFFIPLISRPAISGTNSIYDAALMGPLSLSESFSKHVC